MSQIRQLIGRTVKMLGGKQVTAPPQGSLTDAITAFQSTNRNGFYPDLVAQAVPICTTGPFLHSIGDISVAETTQRYLLSQGVPSYLAGFWDAESKTRIIGGGDILNVGTRNTYFEVCPKYFPEGQHILNAVGVNTETTDLSRIAHLKEYKHLTVRDNEGADFLATAGINASVVPCPATLQHSIPLNVLQHLPRYEAIRALVPEEYVVLHKHPLLNQVGKRLTRERMPFVVVDMQPHRQHPWSGGGIVLPPMHAPAIIKGIVDSARFVLTASLHLVIFSIGANKPFAIPFDSTYQIEKLRRYCDRAGLDDVIVRSIPDLFDRAQGFSENDFDAERKECDLALEHLQLIKECLIE